MQRHARTTEGRLDRLAEGDGVLEAEIAVLLQSAQHHPIDGGRDVQVAPPLAGRLGRIGEVTADDAHRRVGVERDVARHQLVKDHRRRIQVGAAVQPLGARLLRRHVLGRAAHQALHGQHRRSIVLFLGQRCLRDAEVAHLDEVFFAAALDEHDVARLEIAVDDPLRVRLVQRVQDLRHDPCHAPQRQRKIVADHLREVAPREQLHRDVQRAVLVFTRVDDLDGVRVVEQRRALRLALEAAHQPVVLQQVVVEDLDRHRFAQ
jgi:hypothetical protein